MTVEVHVHPNAVDIIFAGLDRWMCFEDRLIIPMDEITSARVVPVAEAKRDLGWRTLGAYLPRYFATGRYTVPSRKGARQLWCVYRDLEVLVIETNKERPARVVLQHPDRHNLAWLIGERITAAG